jgi:hypothetical protein
MQHKAKLANFGHIKNQDGHSFKSMASKNSHWVVTRGKRTFFKIMEISFFQPPYWCTT